MSNDKIIAIIDKVAQDTKSNKIIWERISNALDSYSENKMLTFYLNKAHKEFIENETQERIVKEESYYAKYKGGNIYLFGLYDTSFNKEVHILAVQRDSNAKLSPLNKTDAYQSNLMRLQYLIEEMLNDVDGFLDTILDD